MMGGGDRGHDGGLLNDLARILAGPLDRRGMIRVLAGASLVPLLGCASSSGSDGECATIPEETAGPYPGDGSNGVNALTMSGIVRSDIRSSIGGYSGTAAGVPLTVELTLVGSNDACQALAGYAIYLWHCDRDGEYSLYTLANQSYLRGVQETDAEGKVTFQTIFPGCYSGRMPHLHFEVYPGLSSATDGSLKLATSQLAFPEAPCDEVYGTSGYGASANNFARIDFDSDNVFSDGVEQQLAEVSGDTQAGYIAKLTVAIEV